MFEFDKDRSFVYSHEIDYISAHTNGALAFAKDIPEHDFLTRASFEALGKRLTEEYDKIAELSVVKSRVQNIIFIVYDGSTESLERFDESIVSFETKDEESMWCDNSFVGVYGLLEILSEKKIVITDYRGSRHEFYPKVGDLFRIIKS